jgi:hypothetical protein
MREQTRIEFCRDAAARFQLLADIEPWPSLRQQYGDSAAQYRAEAAALLKERPSEEPGSRQRAA